MTGHYHVAATEKKYFSLDLVFFTYNNKWFSFAG